MNSHRRVLVFVISSTALLLLVSFLSEIFHFKSSSSLNNINLIADILKKDSTVLSDTSGNTPGIEIAEKAHEDFMLYRKGHFITDFNTDTSNPSLTGFLKKLHELKNGKKRKQEVYGGNLFCITNHQNLSY